MKNTIYLLGAGASCECLPLVKDIAKSLHETVEILEDNLRLAERNKSYWDGPNVDLRRLAHRQLIDDLKWLHASAMMHASVDTLAKKLFLIGDPDYRRLKAALTGFFVIRQVLNKPDLRYDTFLASVLTKDLKIPDHIKIVSWNYDFQFEKAFGEYLKTNQVGQIRDSLGVAQKFIDTVYMGDKRLFKINGTTYIKHESGGLQLYAFTSPNESKEKFFHDFSISYHSAVHIEKKNELTLSFAWEKSDFIDQVKKVFDSSNILVVIGYSFPFFNREVDALLLSKMNVQKVYIQDIMPDQIWSRIKAIRPDLPARLLEKISVTKEEFGQFYLPSEI